MDEPLLPPARGGQHSSPDSALPIQASRADAILLLRRPNCIGGAIESSL